MQARDVEGAEVLARTIIDSRGQVEALIYIARALADADDRDRAAVLATEAEQLARTITSPDLQARALAGVAAAVAQAGDADLAETLARHAAGLGEAHTLRLLLAEPRKRAGGPDGASALYPRAINSDLDGLRALARLREQAGDQFGARRIRRFGLNSAGTPYWLDLFARGCGSALGRPT